MSERYLADLIRYDLDHFVTPNIYDVTEDNQLVISCKPFQEANEEQQLFLFVSYNDRLYLPIWFEFRTIDNNLLFLIEEFKINSFNQLQKILNSSLKKVEGVSVTMKAIVYHTNALPSFMHQLSDFSIEDDLRIDLYQK